jgi:hypothetical protein
VGSYTGYDDAYAVFGVSPENNIRDTIYELLAPLLHGCWTVDSQRYSSVLVKFTVYTRRMQADKLALRNTTYQQMLRAQVW